MQACSAADAHLPGGVCLARLTRGSALVRRKAYRLGKWLADVNAVRKTPLSVRYSYLEILASGGEGVYYFVEQLTWCALHVPAFAQP